MGFVTRALANIIYYNFPQGETSGRAGSLAPAAVILRRTVRHTKAIFAGIIIITPTGLHHLTRLTSSTRIDHILRAAWYWLLRLA